MEDGQATSLPIHHPWAPRRQQISSFIGRQFLYRHRLVEELFQENLMLKYAIIFALISLVAGVFGFGGVAAGTAGIARILFGLFLILAVIFIVLAALGVGAVKK